MLVFCSNDYLGLANHPEIAAAFKRAADVYGVGSGAAHLINGHSREHHELENELAEFTSRERVLLFSTGYMANLGVINALVGRGDTIYEDRLNHASLIDAGLLSAAKMVRYPHNDLGRLQQQMKSQTGGSSMIVSDGVFSMDGDIASVDQLYALAYKHQSWLMIDDAHGFGVLGKHGAGLMEGVNTGSSYAPLLMATLGKAMGTAGAFVAADEDVIEYLIQAARTWIYTTAMPPALAAATRTSLKLVQRDSWRREKIQHLISIFKQGAEAQGLKLLPSDTPIQPLLVGDTQLATKLSQRLEHKGILVSAIRPPTVPEGSARLRITLSAAHEESDIKRLLDALAKKQQLRIQRGQQERWLSL